jgi:hypothetical protein
VLKYSRVSVCARVRRAHRLPGRVKRAIVTGPSIPKALTPLASLRCDLATEQALRRFAGWALVLGGLGYASAWLVAPIESARYWAIAALGSALLLVVVRYGLIVMRRQ